MDRPTSFRLTRPNPMELWLMGCLVVIHGGMWALLSGGEDWTAILGTPVFAVGVAVCLLTCATSLRNRLSFPLQLTAGLIATAAGMWQAATGGDLMAMGAPATTRRKLPARSAWGSPSPACSGAFWPSTFTIWPEIRAAEQIDDPASAD